MALTLQKHTAIAPDGRRVTVECRADLQDGWFWQARMTSKTLAIGVSVAHAGYADSSIDENGYETTHTVTYHGHPLRIAVSPLGEGFVVAWRSKHHSVVFGGAGPAPRPADIVALLDQFSILDGRDGLVLRPLPGTDIVMWNLYGVKFTAAGMLTVYPRDEAAGLVPESPGLAVGSGTVWKKTLDSGTASKALAKYVHVGADAVAMLNDDLGRDPDVTEAGQEALLESLVVTWTKARS